MLKQIIGGFVTAFSMYSIVPMPQREWTKDTMKYAMCFFPFVGLLIGAVLYGWTYFSLSFSLDSLLFSAVASILPVILSGGIHLDGFIDTSDALYSRQSRERKLEILKDPHVGAFGIISCTVYFILMIGLFSQFYQHADLCLTVILGLGYLASRALSSLAVVRFRTAKNSGLVYLFSSQAQKGTVQVVNLLTLIFCYVPMFFFDWIAALLLIGVHLIFFFLFRFFIYHEFGGMTGDLAGFFICTTELISLFVIMLGGLL